MLKTPLCFLLSPHLCRVCASARQELVHHPRGHGAECIRRSHWWGQIGNRNAKQPGLCNHSVNHQTLPPLKGRPQGAWTNKAFDQGASPGPPGRLSLTTWMVLGSAQKQVQQIIPQGSGRRMPSCFCFSGFQELSAVGLIQGLRPAPSCAGGPAQKAAPRAPESPCPTVPPASQPSSNGIRRKHCYAT